MLELYIFDTKEYASAVSNQLELQRFTYRSASLTIFPSVNNNLCEVGRNSTFSGLYFDGAESEEAVRALICKMLKWCKSRFTGFRIRVPPEYLETQLYPHLKIILSNEKANITIEINQHIAIRDRDYSFHFSETNRKIVRRSIVKGYSVESHSNIIKAGYDLLKHNREKRGATLSLSYKELKHQSITMPQYYIFFQCLTLDKKIIAYAVCVRIRSDILYVLYWGEDSFERKNSPVVFLAKSIIEYCIEKRINYLDIGISSLNGKLDQTLYDFKQRLGCESSVKYIVESRYA